MIKSASFGWLMAFLFSSPFFHPSILELSPVETSPAVISPGKMVTIAIRVSNHSADSAWINTQVELPTSWKIISDDRPFLLAGGQTDIRLLTILAPLNTPAGSYEIRYRAHSSQSESSVFSDCPVSVNVDLSTRLEIFLFEAPSYVVAGKEIQAKFVIRNQSNFSQPVRLVSYNCEILGEQSFLLPADSVRMVLVKAATRSEATAIIQQSLRLDAQISGNNDYRVSVIEHIEVIPSYGGSETDPHKTVPLLFRLLHLTRQLGQGEVVSSFQGEFLGKANLDDAGKKQVEFHLRGPDRFTTSGLGFYEEYAASYRSPTASFFIGDKTFSLTQLSVFARYARGVEASRRVDEVEIGGFYHQPRFFPEVKKSMAGYLRWHFNPENRVGFSVLNNIYRNNDGGNGQLFNLNGEFLPFSHTRLEAEISTGFRNGKWDNAAWLQVASRPIEKLHLSGMALFAGKNYPGYYRNTLNYSGMLIWRMNKKLEWLASGHQDEVNSARDTLFASAPRSKRWQTGLNFLLGNRRTQLRTLVFQHEFDDRMPAKLFNYRVKGVRIQAFHQFSSLQASVTGELGKRTNFLVPPEFRQTDDRRGTLELNWQARPKLAFQGFANYFFQKRESSFRQENWIFGVGGNGELGPKTTVRLHFQNNYNIEDYLVNRSLAELSLTRRIGKEHEIAIEARHNIRQQTLDQKDAALSLSYTWRPEIIRGKKKESGSVSGRILREGAGSVRGVRLLLNGRTAVSDADGFFEFKNVPPGTHFLMLDPTSVGLHEVSTVKMPIQLTVGPTSKQTVQFGLTAAGRIRGIIRLEKTGLNAPTLGEEEIRLPSVVLELKGEGEIFRQFSGEDNRFDFSDLRPGQYTLQVFRNNLPKNLSVGKETFEFSVAPGNVHDIEIKVFKKEKTIRFSPDVLHIGGSPDGGKH